MQAAALCQLVGIAREIRHDWASRGAGRRRRGFDRSGLGRTAQPCTIALSIMQWMPLEPFTVWVTRRSAARLHSV